VGAHPRDRLRRVLAAPLGLGDLRGGLVSVRPQRLELGQQLAAAGVERGDLVNGAGELRAAPPERGANRVALLADQPQIDNGRAPSWSMAKGGRPAAATGLFERGAP
jgi:hypothetical protein